MRCNWQPEYTHPCPCIAEQTNQQIADQLDVSRGTVDGLLRRGRNLLRIRLVRRGVSLGVLTVATGLVSEASTATSSQLLNATTNLGIQTLSNSVPGTTDLSRLEPLVRPETAMLSSKLAMTGILCVAGAIGLQGLEADGDDDGGTVVTAGLDSDVGTGPVDGTHAVSAIIVSEANPADASNSTVQPTAIAHNSIDGGGVGRGTQFDPWPDDAQPVEKWMFEILNEQIPQLDYRGETSLGEILDDLAVHFSAKNGTAENGLFTLRIWPDQLALELADIGSLDDVKVSGIALNNMTLRSTL